MSFVVSAPSPTGPPPTRPGRVPARSAGTVQAMDNDKIAAVQAVVDRVGSYQEGATEGTIERELRSALAETDLDLTDDQVTQLADAIESEHGIVDAATVLG